MSREPIYHCDLDPSEGFCGEDVHRWFELSYASYLTVPRSLLQEMPPSWQHALVRLLDEMDARYSAPLDHGHYTVLTYDESGRFVSDPLRDYRHPDRRAIERALR